MHRTSSSMVSCIRILNLIHEYKLEANEAEEIIRTFLLPALYKGRWTVANAIDALRKFEKISRRVSKPSLGTFGIFCKASLLTEKMSTIAKSRKPGWTLNSLLFENKYRKIKSANIQGSRGNSKSIKWRRI